MQIVLLKVRDNLLLGGELGDVIPRFAIDLARLIDNLEDKGFGKRDQRPFSRERPAASCRGEGNEGQGVSRNSYTAGKRADGHHAVLHQWVFTERNRRVPGCARHDGE